MSEALLTWSQVSFGYPGADWRLSKIDLNLQRGTLLGIVGPNGSGKSTLLKLAAGILTPDQGEVALMGSPLAAQSRRDIARQLGYLPQTVRPSYDHQVLDVVGMGRFCRQQGLGFISAEDQNVIERCLVLTETQALANRLLSHLSGGERQRVLLASVLAQEPDVLLLDEPTTGLDLHHQVSFFKLLSRFACEGLAMAVVTHDWNLAAQFCDELLLLKEGSVAAHGTIDDVMQPEILRDLFGPDLLLSKHPVNGRPIVLPLPETRDA